jgi:hypothetical protein
MAKYAADTSVSAAKSRIEIEETLMKYGADSFAYATMDGKAAIAFRMSGRQARITLPLPRLEDYRLTETGRERTKQSQQTAWEQACRQNWRIMLLMIKAKLEAIEAEVSTFDREFMADMLLPDGHTVGEVMAPQIEVAYATGRMPALLPGISE